MFWKVKSKFLKIYIDKGYDVMKSPTQNFAICFTQNKDFMRKNMAMVKPLPDDFIHNKYEYVINEDFAYKDTFESL
jgi:hypothetical protein